MRKRAWNFVDSTGNKFGRLTAIELVDGPVRGKSYYRCVCDCGNETVVWGGSLRNGMTKSCGCLKNEILGINRYVDRTGQRFGRLTAIEDVGRTTGGAVLWRCICDCGVEVEVDGKNLGSGNSKSCGCLNREKRSERFKAKLDGKRFGRLLVVKDSGRRSKHMACYWDCLCDCGKTTQVSTRNLMNGHVMSCGCIRRIDYGGHRFRSSWELFFYIACEIRNMVASYEPITFSVDVDGKTRKYTPDFWVNELGSFVEIKGIAWQLGMKKITAVKSQGIPIQTFRDTHIEEWCGCSIEKMWSVYSTGGVDGIKSLLSSSIMEATNV